MPRAGSKQPDGGHCSVLPISSSSSSSSSSFSSYPPPFLPRIRPLSCRPTRFFLTPRLANRKSSLGLTTVVKAAEDAARAAAGGTENHGEAAASSYGSSSTSGTVKKLQLGFLFGLWYLFNIYFNIYDKQVCLRSIHPDQDTLFASSMKDGFFLARGKMAINERPICLFGNEISTAS
ncbi:hypothetical protein BHE74_00010847 [Ensete ventricosum]|uniref:Uncharacterized protein n=1 Tax=Ensete ventricosum TaxID=4639 RepID=A0A427AR60_ENSVE|nr:hypothetical protein B296_00007977 [Ensete ventricosum]RWW80796.1 hypothetical protein BHE74_00010847 [Ensete ventricosum]RZR78832.1 hypothetical protein BHM03_00004381 [Ensete ventricosum]